MSWTTVYAPFVVVVLSSHVSRSNRCESFVIDLCDGGDIVLTHTHKHTATHIYRVITDSYDQIRWCGNIWISALGWTGVALLLFHCLMLTLLKYFIHDQIWILLFRSHFLRRWRAKLYKLKNLNINCWSSTIDWFEHFLVECFVQRAILAIVSLTLSPMTDEPQK